MNEKKCYICIIIVFNINNKYICLYLNISFDSVSRESVRSNIETSGTGVYTCIPLNLPRLHTYIL